ncbi:MAG: hypothetical protein K0Q47_82 [Sedimentibacter sp.]|nr:hypothetical protein [Sedimentibacter sp.]
MVKKILIAPHPILKKVCEEVQDFNEEVKTEALDLEETLKANLRKAVGLAASQIGYIHRIIAFMDLKDGNVISMINPVITYYSKDDMIHEFEACVSYPGKRKKIYRAKEIVVEGYSHSGVPIKYSMEDLQARIIQHEVDHLNGKCRVSMR